MTPQHLRILGIHSLDIDLDLTTLPPGLICVVGPNGAGKTTLMEMMGPGGIYRHAPTRPSAKGLLHMATQRDAIVDLVVSHNEIEYRHLHQLDPDANGGRGKAEAYLYGTDQPLNNGKMKTYDDAICQHYPDRSIFLASVYAAQDGAGNFTGMAKSERRGLFAKLLGVGYLQELAMRAKIHRQALDAALGELERREETVLENKAIAANVSASLATIRNAGALLVGPHDQAQAKANETHRAWVASSSAVEAETQAHRQWDRTINAAMVRREKGGYLQGRLNEEIAHLQDVTNPAAIATMANIEEAHTGLEIKVQAARDAWKQAETAEGAARRVVDYETAECTKADMRADQFARALLEYKGLATLVEIADQHGVAQQANQRANQAAVKALGALGGIRQPEVIEAELTSAKAGGELVAAVPCRAELLFHGGAARHPGDDGEVDCGKCTLLAAAKDAAAQLSALNMELGKSQVLHEESARCTATANVASMESQEWAQKLLRAERRNKLTEELSEAREAQAARKSALDAATRDRDAALAKKAEQWGLGKQLKAEMAELPSSKMDEITKAQERLKFATKDLEACEADLAQVAEEITHLKANKSPLPSLADTERLGAESDAASRTFGSFRQQKHENTVNEAKLVGRLEGLGDLEGRSADITAKRKVAAGRLRGFVLLEKALGRDGIQALEIDAAGPEVSQLVTDLLRSCYGTRFAVELRTVRPAEKGRKQTEVFDLLIHDSRRLDVGTFDQLSGGEKVIVDEALKLAIAIFNARRHGNMRTLWRDEADGRLDPEVRAKYPAMLRRAIDLGGFDRLYYVSHDVGVQSQADAQIVLTASRTARIVQ